MAVAWIVLFWIGGVATTFAQQGSAGQLAPWLDVPPAWSRTVQQGVVAVSPNDLAPGAQLIMMVEPAKQAQLLM